MKLNDIYAELTQLIGRENTRKIHKYYKGQQVSFPLQLYDKEQIHQQIVAEYDGSNSKQLAKKYGYSERWVYKVINEAKKQTE